jgi:kynurenine formamidase
MKRIFPFTLPVILAACMTLHPGTTATTYARAEVTDHSLLIDVNYPCTWPTHLFPKFQIQHFRTIGPSGPYNIDNLVIDGNTGTQIDVPPHSIPGPGTNLPNEGPLGLAYIDVTAPFKFVGQACVIDVSDLLDKAENGTSPLIEPDHVTAWEKKHRKLGPGDVAIFRNGYSDRYYKPFPEGDHFIADVMDNKVPAWPDPSPDCMDLLGRRGVKHVVVDAPSMGPRPDLAEATHYAGLKYDQIFTEGATRLGGLPPTGAFYCAMGPRHKNGIYGEGRAFSITPGKLADRLNKSAKAKRVVDLTVVLDMDFPVTWPGRTTATHRTPYIRVEIFYAESLGVMHDTHMMDALAGTHVVPPAYSLPEAGFNNSSYSPQVLKWLTEYETSHGKRGTSSMTTEAIPLSQMQGNLRIIDVMDLVGTTDKSNWPASPLITLKTVKAYEKAEGKIRKGEVVVFRTGHIDRTFRKKPDDGGCMADPLAGESEGWPAATPETIQLLASRGVSCVGIDAPNLGGVDEKNELFVNWAAGSAGMVAVEFLHNLGSVPKDGDPFFIFSPIKINDGHGGHGRAIVLY